MVRIPDELAERISAAGHKREPFVRGAVEAALGTDSARLVNSEPDNGTSNPAVGGSSSRRSSGSAGSTPAPAPPRVPESAAMARQRKLNEAKYKGH